MSGRLAQSVVIATLLAAGLAACGEKEEPEITSPPEEATVIPDYAPSYFKGVWAGELRQSGLKPFSIKVDIRGFGRQKSSVRYAGAINCAGTWTPEPSNGTAFVFREVIDRGENRTCKGVGTVTLTPVGERLLYEFKGGGIESRGRLHRVG